MGILREDHPEIYQQLDSKKNTVETGNISSGSHKKMYWKCEKGHSWNTSIKARVEQKTGCPVCSNKKVLAGYNDLATTHPQVLICWDYDKNEILPTEVTTGSSKKVWWVCEKGHSYQQTVYSKTGSRIQGCPYCAGKKVLAGFNDLATLSPEVASEWDYDRNTVPPTAVSNGSHKKYWWVCSLGHSYDASVKNRVERKSSCPYCSGHKVLSGFNDLATTHPEIVDDWDFVKNIDISPSEVSAGSHKKAWWVCDVKHTFLMEISGKVRRPKSCPVCSGRKIVSGINDIESQSEKLLSLWNFKKNTVSPNQVLTSSQKNYWWLCENGHEWETTPVSLLMDNIGCPYCSGHRIWVGFNDLATTHPEIAVDWDYVKNIGLNPQNVSKGSRRKVWWKCDKHSGYEMLVSKRTSGQGCPQCAAGMQVSRAEQELVGFIESHYSGEVLTSIRSIISPKELDIYIPEKKIAIEFNGLYWHTESQGKDRNYHYNKWKACQDKDIQLVTIWEDDWMTKKDVVKQMILHKLGLPQSERILAKKTTVVSVERDTAQQFCEENYIQGFVGGSIYIGLQDNRGDLVALSIWTESKDVLYLQRYCISIAVIGGMERLLKEGIQFARENNIPQIVTFSDHEVSDGGLYDKLGFSQVEKILPDYKYVYRNKRYHNFDFRLKGSENDSELLYIEGLSEKELADLNGIERVWDCGKTKWMMTVD